jgi:membrane protein YqaA with SNARE-associated domain
MNKEGDNTLDTSYERLYNHANSKWSLIIAFIWGFAEATLFFIVPDVYLGFVALFHWRRGLSAAIAALLGAMLGGSVMYVLATNDPSGINELLIRVPLIDTALVNEVAGNMRADGLVTILTGPLKGTPYKIYAAQAGEQAFSFLSFLLMTIPARLERFIPIVLIFGGLGGWFQTFCKKHTTLVVMSYVLLWCMIYFVFIIYFGFH